VRIENPYAGGRKMRVRKFKKIYSVPIQFMYIFGAVWNIAVLNNFKFGALWILFSILWGYTQFISKNIK